MITMRPTVMSKAYHSQKTRQGRIVEFSRKRNTSLGEKNQVHAPKANLSYKPLPIVMLVLEEDVTIIQ